MSLGSEKIYIEETISIDAQNVRSEPIAEVSIRMLDGRLVSLYVNKHTNWIVLSSYDESKDIGKTLIQTFLEERK